MPRTCTVCAHPQRTGIDRALVGGASNRSIALHFGVSHMAVQRHRAHLAPLGAAVVSEHSETFLELCEAVLVSLQTLRVRLPQHPPGRVVEPLQQAVQAVETLKRALGAP